MAGTITIGNEQMPFDEELFQMYFEAEPDLVTNAMVRSGAMVENGAIAALIANGSATYTIPFYNNLADDEDDNYDGATDITLSVMTGASQTGVVYGRSHAWQTADFVADFTAANPVAAIAARVSKYWQTRRQHRLIGITEAVLSSALSANVKDASAGITPTLLSDAAQEFWGEHKGIASLAIMHSSVAQQFEDLQRVEYLTYTDPNGVSRALPVYTVNGLTVIVDDSVPTELSGATGAGVYTVAFSGTFAPGDKVTVNGTTLVLDATSAATPTAVATAVVSALGTPADYTLSRSTYTITFTEKSGSYGAGVPKANVVSPGGGKVAVATTTEPTGATRLYSTYLFGAGAIHYASAPVAHPFFVDRDELRLGGIEFLGNRLRETIHPNGLSYALASGVTSPSDAALADASKWTLAYSDPKMIPFGKVLSPAAAAV